MKTRNWKPQYFIGLLFLTLLIFVPVKTASAASAYTSVVDQDDFFSPVKKGDYYFKLSKKTYHVLQSKSKKGTYKDTKMNSDALGNKTEAYYVENDCIYRYTYSTKKTVELKNISSCYPSDAECFSTIGYVYGGKIYVNMMVNYTPSAYAYNLKTGTYKKLKNKCQIITGKGKYVLTSTSFRTDVSTDHVILYKITSSGLTKVKDLAKYGYLTSGAVISGKYVYYINYKSVYMGAFTLYRCTLSTGKVKKIKAFSASSGTMLMPVKMTGSYIRYFKGEKLITYKY